jgi:hypothetical protein
VQKQQLRDAMTAAHQIAAHLLTAASKVAGRLERRRRHRDRRQLPSEQKPGQQLGVFAVCLDPVTGSPWRLRRGDHLDREPGRRRGTVEPVTGRAGLITALQRQRQRLQPLDHLIGTAAEARTPQLTACDIDRRSMRRASMDIKPHVRHRFQHGRTSFAWGQPEPISGQTNPRTREVSGLQPLTATQTP